MTGASGGDEITGQEGVHDHLVVTVVRPADDEMDVPVIFLDEGSEMGAHGVAVELIWALSGGVGADVGAR
jgi:hypothetical protein